MYLRYKVLLCAILTVLVATGYAASMRVPDIPIAHSASTPDGLTIRWFGASTLTINDDSGSAIMIDGFFSRPGIGELGLAALGLPLIDSDPEEVKAAIEGPLKDMRIKAIFVAHAHHDHVLDTASIAVLKGAEVHGSVSARNVMQGQIAPDRLHDLVAGKSIIVDDKFMVLPLASPHQPTWFGPEGEIERPLRMPAKLRAFKSGPSFAFLIKHRQGSLLVVPSAIVDGQAPDLGVESVDAVLLGIGLLGKESVETMARYWTDVVCKSQATRVHPIHWDNFMRPLDEDLRSIPSDRLYRSIANLSEFARSDDIEFSYLPISTPVRLPAPGARRAKSDFCPFGRR